VCIHASTCAILATIHRASSACTPRTATIPHTSAYRVVSQTDDADQVVGCYEHEASTSTAVTRGGNTILRARVGQVRLFAPVNLDLDNGGSAPLKSFPWRSQQIHVTCSRNVPTLWDVAIGYVWHWSSATRPQSTRCFGICEHLRAIKLQSSLSNPTY